MEKHVPFGFSEITWSDFKGPPEDDEITLKDRIGLADASINSTFFYKMNRVYNYPQIISISAMKPLDSWTKSRDKYLLKHEKTHFLISEYYSRKVNSLAKIWPNNVDSIESRISFYYDSLHIMQKTFDSETFHGSDLDEEIVWEKRIAKLLEE